MKFKDIPTSEVINDIYARFFKKKIKIVNENGNKRYKHYNSCSESGKYTLKKFQDNEENYEI